MRLQKAVRGATRLPGETARGKSILISRDRGAADGGARGRSYASSSRGARAG